MVGRVEAAPPPPSSSSTTSSSFVGLLDRKSSIEREPRTLNLQQIQFAREAALYVLNTRSMEEALQIFTDGLQPVMSNKPPRRQQQQQQSEELEEPPHTITTADEPETEIICDGCPSSYSTAGNRCLLRLPSRIRDVYTAPF